jgi:hypothetical protein
LLKGILEKQVSTIVDNFFKGKFFSRLWHNLIIDKIFLQNKTIGLTQLIKIPEVSIEFHPWGGIRGGIILPERR